MSSGQRGKGIVEMMIDNRALGKGPNVRIGQILGVFASQAELAPLWQRRL
jgi:hypothetical protein